MGLDRCRMERSNVRFADHPDNMLSDPRPDLFRIEVRSDNCPPTSGIQ